jgi:hypothetical protein
VGVLDASTSPPKERYAVSKDNINKLIQPGNVEDQLTEILRNGARDFSEAAGGAARQKPIATCPRWVKLGS